MKALIQQHQTMRISELSKRLQVSEMTVHRDLKPLIEEGLVSRTYGGVEWKTPVENQSRGCPLCERTGDQRLLYRLMLNDQQVETACCPHCGLIRHRQKRGQVVQVLCQDFFTNTTISAEHAWFVFDPQVEIGCCHPQVVSFASKETAERFIVGFGGSLHSHASASDQLHGNARACHSSQKGVDPS
ncbi:NosL protein [Desmospora activa DSM 45169]|uniref:NosL protein n=2 Tax=Desmospora TaxID=500614 RepID=A0A2T4ZA39_9BACL|nr:NosL protein [Desmospora activa DSM 45169]